MNTETAKVWNLMCRTDGRVISHDDNPVTHEFAIEGAAVYTENGWEVWVEHHESGEIILQNPAEIVYQKNPPTITPNPSFEEFKRVVKAARPDLKFLFTQGDTNSENHSARWRFSGCVYRGGSVMWTHGTRKLSWGIASGDMESWISFETANGREPRFT